MSRANVTVRPGVDVSTASAGLRAAAEAACRAASLSFAKGDPIELFDLGAAVRMQVDQVWHIAMIAAAALLVTL